MAVSIERSLACSPTRAATCTIRRIRAGKPASAFPGAGQTAWGSSGFDIRALTQAQAVTFYREYWWDEYRYAEDADQRVAEELLDMAVVAGPSASHFCLQRALLAVSVVAEDAVPASRHGRRARAGDPRGAANRAPAHCLLAALKSEQAGYFRDLDKPRFEKGWEARACSRDRERSPGGAV